MTPLGERLIEFLRSQPDVTEVRDVSISNARGTVINESVSCRHRGANYRVSVIRLVGR